VDEDGAAVADDDTAGGVVALEGPGAGVVGVQS
jgi:hypothetical protein